MKEKKHIIGIIFATLAAFLWAGNAHCQQALTQASYSATITNTIVREYKYPATISYVETTSEHHFAYADASMTVRNAVIDPDLFFTDMQVHGDYVYFCGYNIAMSKAVWGWFDINTLIAGNLVFYTYTYFTCGSLLSDTLYSLCTFEESGKLHIATVGTTTDGASKRLPCIIDIYGTEGSVTGWSYDIGVSTCDNSYTSRLTTVCATDKFIVTAGSFLGMPSEGYHIHYRNNMFLSGGPQDSIYTFTFFQNADDHNGFDMAMTHTNGDTIASAVYWYFQNPYDFPQGILVNVYDINQVITIPAASPVYTMQALVPQLFFPDTNIYNIRNIVYSKPYNELVLLTSGNFPYGLGTGSIVTELPLPPSTSANFTMLQDHILTSLDTYNGQQSILAQGYDNYNPGTSSYFTQPLATIPLCGTPGIVPLSSPTYAAKKRYCPYSICSDKFDCICSKQIKSYDINNVINCNF